MDRQLALLFALTFLINLIGSVAHSLAMLHPLSRSSANFVKLI